MAQVHQLSGRLFGRILREHGIKDLNPAQGRIIFALWREDGLTQAELAACTKLDKSTLTAMLDRLEEAGQIRRETDAVDHRIRRIHLTARNLKLHATYGAASDEMFRHYYRGLKAVEITALEATLRRLVANLEEALGQ